MKRRLETPTWGRGRTRGRGSAMTLRKCKILERRLLRGLIQFLQPHIQLRLRYSKQALFHLGVPMSEVLEQQAPLRNGIRKLFAE
jgi:hypothetical protein